MKEIKMGRKTKEEKNKEENLPRRHFSSSGRALREKIKSL